MSRDRLQMQVLFLRGTNSKCSNVDERIGTWLLCPIIGMDDKSVYNFDEKKLLHLNINNNNNNKIRMKNKIIA